MIFEYDDKIVTVSTVENLPLQTQQSYEETDTQTYVQKDGIQNNVPDITNDSGVAALLLSAVMAAYAIIDKSAQYYKKKISVFVKSRKRTDVASDKSKFITRIAFANVSNGHIFGKGNTVYSPLCIKNKTDSNAKIYSYRVCYSSPEHIPNVKLSMHENSLIIAFDRLAYMDGFVLEIEHSNNFDKNFKIECEIFDCILSRISIKRKYVILMILFGIILLPLIVLYTILILMRTVLFGAIIVALIAAEVFLFLIIRKERPPKKMREIAKEKIVRRTSK